MARPILRPLTYDRAFVTSVIRFGEADCIARLFLKDQGRISAFMKNGLKPSKTRPASIQAPALGQVGFFRSGSQGLFRLSSLEIDPISLHFSTDLKTFALAHYLAEIIEIFLPEEEPAEVIFVLLEKLSSFLNQKPQALLLRAFELKLLAHCGYLPDIVEPWLEKEPIVAYDPVACSFLTQKTAHSLAFDLKARFWACELLRNPLENLPAVSPDVLAIVGRIFLGRLWLMGKLPLKSVAFIKSLGV